MSYPQPPAAPAPKKTSGAKIAAFGCGGLVLFVILIGVIGAALGLGKSTNTSASSNDSNPNVGISTTKVISASPSAAAPATTKAAAPATSAKPQQDTVTYVLTGSKADVTYGPAGSSLQGHVPMTVTKPLGHPMYYSISAQLNGGGKVTCEIKVNDKVVSKATASGGYNIAMCEIVQDPISGAWQDANGN